MIEETCPVCRGRMVLISWDDTCYTRDYDRELGRWECHTCGYESDEFELNEEFDEDSIDPMDRHLYVDGEFVIPPIDEDQEES